MTDLAGIALLTALGAGAISFLSPCVLPLVPAYVSYVVGSDGAGDQSRPVIPAAVLSLFFVLGFSTVFVALGASATVLGQLLLRYRHEATLAGGSILIVLGLFMMGALRLPWLQRDFRFHMQRTSSGPLGAYVVGIAFAFGWTPCIGPVLGAILTAAAVSADRLDGTALLAVYAAGLGIPFILTAVFARRVLDKLRRLRRAGRALQIAAGAVMVVMGVAMVTGQSTVFALWLLQMFPALATLG